MWFLSRDRQQRWLDKIPFLKLGDRHAGARSPMENNARPQFPVSEPAHITSRPAAVLATDSDGHFLLPSQHSASASFAHSQDPTAQSRDAVVPAQTSSHDISIPAARIVSRTLRRRGEQCAHRQQKQKYHGKVEVLPPGLTKSMSVQTWYAADTWLDLSYWWESEQLVGAAKRSFVEAAFPQCYRPLKHVIQLRVAGGHIITASGVAIFFLQPTDEDLEASSSSAHRPLCSLPRHSVKGNWLILDDTPGGYDIVIGNTGCTQYGVLTRGQTHDGHFGAAVPARHYPSTTPVTSMYSP